MRNLFSKSRHAIIITDHVLRYAEVRNQSLDHINTAAERYIPEGVMVHGQIKEVDTLLSLLQDCVEEWGLKGKEVMFTLPDTQVLVRRHTIPMDVEEDHILGHLYMQLGETLHLPIEQPVFDWYEIERDEEKRDVLLFAAPEPTVTTIARLMREVKMKPRAADLSALSLYRFYDTWLGEETPSHVMQMQVFPDAFHVSIFHDGLPLIVRTMNLQTSMEDWEVNPHDDDPIQWNGPPEKVFSSWKDAVGELNKLLHFYQFNYQHGEAAVSRIRISGDHPYLERIIEDLRASVDLPVDYLYESEWKTSQGHGLETKYYPAVGLALKNEV
ncbi:type IV pilus biogenesis protein PilM [Alkalicoccus chagannorensis]|uniref:type IV pilus biogenesis protein PilM n=1 Tax=Alkalicoccus chagannorensis TaxID=427072 RepID=UPI0003FAD12C|nr:pilus assembly protein PilM [Alkalicoccus chagannorensis]